MDDLDELTEVAACIEAARLAILPLIRRAEQREQARLRKARQRLNAPTTQSERPAGTERIAG